MTAHPLRVAFLGVDHPHGSGWRESLAQVTDDIALVGIVPRFGGALASLEERYAGLPRFDTVGDLLAWNEFDGAVICLSNAETPAAVSALARAGKAVLVEKPGAGSASALTAAMQAVEQHGVVFQSGYMWRYDPATQRLRAMLQEGRFGRLISIEMTYFTSDVRRRGPEHYLFDPDQSEHGFFNWLACHWLDLLLYLTDQKVIAVTARVGCFGASPISVDDGGTAVLELSGGALVTFTGGYWLPRWTGESRWSLRGSERWVHWEPSRPGTGGVLEIHGPQPQFMAMNETWSVPADTTPGYGGRRNVELLLDWVDAARHHTQCRNTPQSMLVTLRLLDAIYQSSAEGRRITCDIG